MRIPFHAQAMTLPQMMFLDELLHRHRARIPVAVSGPGIRMALMPPEVRQEIDGELARMIRQAHLLERSFNTPAVDRG